MPTAAEWVDYNVKLLEKPNFQLPDAQGAAPSGVYLLENYMPALVLRLTRPDLTWCIDVDMLNRHETRINVGSSYFVLDMCILGPSMHYADLALDRRAAAYMRTFAGEVSNGLRWILQIYQTTNILRQHDLFNADLAVARNIRNKLAFGNYTPVQLVTELGESTDCQAVPMCATADRPFYKQSFGLSSGTTAPIGSVGQFTRPYLGTASLSGLCSNSADNLAVRDPDVLSAEERKRLNEMITTIREEMKNGYFQSAFGLASRSEPVHYAVGRPTDSCSPASHHNNNGNNNYFNGTVDQVSTLTNVLGETRSEQQQPPYVHRPDLTDLNGGEYVRPSDVDMENIDSRDVINFFNSVDDASRGGSTSE